MRASLHFAVFVAGLIGLFAALTPTAAGADDPRPRVHVVAFAMDGTLGVFRSEATRAAAIVAARYGGADRVVRVNKRDGGEATLADLRAVVAEVGGRMAPTDVLFLIVTSHGSPAGVGIRAGRSTETLTPRDVADALALARIENAVIVVSACYSGIFADTLAGPGRAVITASDATHPSFGCRPGEIWTYFGETSFADALPKAPSLRAAFDTATVAIAAREKARRFAPSNPRFAGGERVLARLEGAAAPMAPSPPAPTPAPALTTAAPAAATPPIGCDLKPEPSPAVAGCEVFNGYAAGRFVGSFHLGGGRTVSAGGACPDDWPKGRLVGPGRLSVAGAVYTLRPDCRGSTRTSR